MDTLLLLNQPEQNEAVSNADLDSEMSDISEVINKVLRVAGKAIEQTIAEAIALVGIGVGDVVEIPAEDGMSGSLPFCSNPIAVADAVGTSGEFRMAIVTKVNLMIDFDGRHSVNWIGNVMDTEGNWLDMEVLLARIDSGANEELAEFDNVRLQFTK